VQISEIRTDLVRKSDLGFHDTFTQFLKHGSTTSTLEIIRGSTSSMLLRIKWHSLIYTFRIYKSTPLEPSVSCET